MFVRCPHLGPCLSASIWVHICQVPPSVSVFVSLHLGPCLSDASICVNVCQPPSVSMFDSLHLGPWLSGASAPCCQPPSGSKLVRCCWSMVLASISLSDASVWVHVCQVPPSVSMFSASIWVHFCQVPPFVSMLSASMPITLELSHQQSKFNAQWDLLKNPAAAKPTSPMTWNPFFLYILVEPN